LGGWYNKIPGLPQTVGDAVSKIPLPGKVGELVQKLPGMNKGVGELIDKIPGMPSMPDADSIFL
jgi:hypothetical protein